MVPYISLNFLTPIVLVLVLLQLLFQTQPSDAVINVKLWNSPNTVRRIQDEFVASNTVVGDRAAVEADISGRSSQMTLVAPGDPLHGCRFLDSPPYFVRRTQPQSSKSVNWVVLVNDVGCDLRTKVHQAHKNGFSGIIVYSTASNSPKRLASDPDTGTKINISFVGLKDGLYLKDNVAYPKTYQVEFALSRSLERRVPDEYASTKMLVILLLALTVGGLLLYSEARKVRLRAGWHKTCEQELAVRSDNPALRFLTEERRARYQGLQQEMMTRAQEDAEARNNPLLNLRSFLLSLSREKRLYSREQLIDFLQTEPVTEELGGDPCAICTDNFNPTDSLINLPCHHKFHRDCVLEWFTTRSSKQDCPLCREELNPHFEAIGEVPNGPYHESAGISDLLDQIDRIILQRVSNNHVTERYGSESE